MPTLGGDLVGVRLGAGTQSGQRLRVKGRGIATRSATGDLIVTVHVVVPQRLTDEARAAVEVLAAEDAETDVRADLRARAARA